MQETDFTWKTLEWKKPRRPRGQKDNTRLIALLHTQISHTIALFSLGFRTPPSWDRWFYLYMIIRVFPQFQSCWWQDFLFDSCQESHVVMDQDLLLIPTYLCSICLPFSSLLMISRCHGSSRGQGLFLYFCRVGSGLVR